MSGRTFNLYFDKNRETLEEIYNKSGLRGVANFVGCCKTTAFNQFNRLGVKIKSSKFKKGCVSFMKGKHFLESSIEKMSLSQKKRFQRENVWNKGKEMGEKFSKKCSIAQKKRFETEDSWNKGNHGFMAGEKHYNWQGGKTQKNRRIRHSLRYRNWREKVFEQDDYTCRMCGVRGGHLHPHHIENFADFPKERFSVKNEVTFCKKCHLLFHSTLGFRNNNISQLNNFLSN